MKTEIQGKLGDSSDNEGTNTEYGMGFRNGVQNVKDIIFKPRET